MVSPSLLSLLLFPLLLLPVCTTSQSPNPCIFNSTHCSCRPVENPGTCLRYQGHASCFVDNCLSNAMTCDCDSSFICRISKCTPWLAYPNTPPLSSFPRGHSLPCRLSSSLNCVSRLPNDPSIHAPQTTHQYTMVQVGPASADTMFNMSLFTDYADFIVTKFNMHALWNNTRLLRRRFITIRLYTSPRGDANMICAIFNTYAVKNDNLGNMLVMTNITGSSAQPLRWAACDDPQECHQSATPSVLTARHALISSLTDGWCVAPLQQHGPEINVKFYSVHGMKGVVLQAVDRVGKDRAFLFEDMVRIGMPGTIDKHGLVRGGQFPEIKFSLKGLEVP